MKMCIVLLFCVCVTSLFGQSYETDDVINNKLSDVFIGLDVTKKPEKIEEEYRMPIDIESGDRIIPKEKNIVRFKTHKIFSGFDEGEFNVNYLYLKEYFDTLGLYRARMSLWFKSKKECIAQYDKAVKLFELFGITKIVTTTRDEFNLERITREETLFIRDRYDEFPRLEISYCDYTDDGEGFALNINYYKSWNNTSTGGHKFFEY